MSAVGGVAPGGTRVPRARGVEVMRAWIRTEQGAPLECRLRVPSAGNRPAKGTLIAIHGIARDVREQVGVWGRFAADHGLAMVAPLFPRSSHPAYQRLGCGVGTSAVRSDEALVQLMAWLEVNGWELPRPWILFGHSGGAQFAHRFALMHPAELDAVILSSAGWYTFPDPETPFPLGLRWGAGWPVGGQVRGWLALPMLVTVGERDCERDASLRCEAVVDERQGRDRVERARRWVASLSDSAVARGWEARVELRELKGAGHAFRECVAAGLEAECRRFLGDLGVLNPAERSGRKLEPQEAVLV